LTLYLKHPYWRAIRPKVPGSRLVSEESRSASEELYGDSTPVEGPDLQREASLAVVIVAYERVSQRDLLAALTALSLAAGTTGQAGA
jgi:hypothetical protein